MTNPERYPAQVFWSDEDEGFIATAPDLPGCSAFGESKAEALDELLPAIVAWIESARNAGNPVPGPSHPANDQYSGKFVLRLPKSMHASLAHSAKMDGVSLNQYVVTLLASTHSIKHNVERQVFYLEPKQHWFSYAFNGNLSGVCFGARQVKATFADFELWNTATSACSVTAASDIGTIFPAFALAHKSKESSHG
ncbi:type II toxin-antitoxin system HicB family antitoxin [Caballeronia sp. GACF4]|uniref:type II toxin-antitoxin system HicB family antitoxin n=1 Tax=Caballeronia sp. GACF4 TaxID=2921763 RepID=UPI00202904C0|nr:type II toxin-antitoxin system HicB family antitoxin [Caballeronia sp. GACF4]